MAIIEKPYGFIRYCNHYLIDLFINKDERRKGYGTELINEMINDMKKRNLKFVILHCRKSNKIGQAFYTKLGFKYVIESINYYGDEDGIIYGKEL